MRNSALSGIGWNYTENRPCFINEYAETLYTVGTHCPRIEGERCYSRRLMYALDENNVFAGRSWPEDLATPETSDMWLTRKSCGRYADIGMQLPDLKVILVFAEEDHCQSAPDKPHVHHAYDGFSNTADLEWVRLNPDLVYNIAMDGAFSSFPEHPANTEPDDWMEISSWAFPNEIGANDLVSLAAGAEMADRVHAGDWSNDLSVVYEE